MVLAALHAAPKPVVVVNGALQKTPWADHRPHQVTMLWQRVQRMLTSPASRLDALNSSWYRHKQPEAAHSRYDVCICSVRCGCERYSP